MAEEDKKQQQPLVINLQYIKDLSFENPNAPLIFPTMQGKSPQLNVEVDVAVTALAEQSFEVSTKFQASTKVEDKTAFMMELDYAGVVTLAEGLEDQLKELLLFVEAPRYLFPAARNILSDISRDGGFPPLILNPVDFHQIYVQRKQQQAAAAAEESMASEEKSEEAAN
ncbi:protein-export chaperone SecB [Kiloniella sp. b19]|uniref:protein-export chaperone SecB n=1 Tax=Kiloniella sp. GXU_MW_B19 TaxID=3141326 RepID=UPI0031E140FA